MRHIPALGTTNLPNPKLIATYRTHGPALGSIGLLLGGIYVLLAVPIAAVLVTLVDVIVRDKDPAEEEVPTLLFPAKDAEA